jgi:hypothetical protein
MIIDNGPPEKTVRPSKYLQKISINPLFFDNPSMFLPSPENKKSQWQSVDCNKMIPIPLAKRPSLRDHHASCFSNQKHRPTINDLSMPQKNQPTGLAMGQTPSPYPPGSSRNMPGVSSLRDTLKFPVEHTNLRLSAASQLLRSQGLISNLVHPPIGHVTIGSSIHSIASGRNLIAGLDNPTTGDTLDTVLEVNPAAKWIDYGSLKKSDTIPFEPLYFDKDSMYKMGSFTPDADNKVQ